MAPSKDRVGEYHKTFARQIIRQLKEGTAPFQKPWKPGERSLPENLATGRRYAGGNSLYLSVAAQMKGYSDNRWATYRQIREAGGHVQRGERATQILFFSTTKLVPAKDDQGNPKLNDAGEPVYTVLERPKPFVRTYSVFNAEQTGGLPERPPATAPPEWEGHAAADAIIETSGVTIKHQAGDRAYYNVRTDQVVLPEPGQFPSAGKYYQTALHELGHSTGHPSRLDRDTLGKKFGSPDYAREELRAEISAMMTGEKIGLGHDPRHGTEYVASWIKALEDDPREIYRAAADAERISRYLIEPARERIERHDAQARGETAAYSPQPPERPSHADQLNRNIEKAATVAIATLNQDGYDTPPPAELFRDLQGVHLAAAQNAFSRQTADFRSLVGRLEAYATDSLSNREQRSAVLALSDNFRDPERLHLRLPAEPITIEPQSPFPEGSQDQDRPPGADDLNRRIRTAATAGLTAVRAAPERLPGDRRVLLSTLHDIDNQAAAGDFDRNSKFSATAQRLHDYAATQNPGPHRDALNNAGYSFRRLPTPKRAVNHRIVDATQDALHHLGGGQNHHEDIADSREELVQDLTRINTTALNNGYSPGDSFHGTTDHLDSFAKHDQVQSPELSRAADHLRAAQYSLDRQLDRDSYRDPHDVKLADATDAATHNDPAFHRSITLRDRVDAHLERQGMPEDHRASFLRHLDATEGGLDNYAADHQIEDPSHIRARESTDREPSLAAQALAASRERAANPGPSR